MQNRIELLKIALATFGALAAENNITAPNGFTAKDTTLYLTKNMKGTGGLEKLIDANTKKIDGVTNFDGNKLDKGRNYMIDSVRVRVDVAAATLDLATWKGTPTAAIKNAVLKVTQGEELFAIPLTDLFNDATSTSNYDDFRVISHLPTIYGDKEYKIDLQYADGTSVPGGGGDPACWLRVEFRAHEIYIK